MENRTFNYSLKPASSFHRTSISEAIILNESQSYKLVGKLYVDVLETLISKHSDFTAALDKNHTPAEVYYALRQLERMGHIVRSGSVEKGAQWWNSFDADAKFGHTVHNSVIAIRSTLAMCRQFLHHAMVKHRFNVKECIEKETKVIVLCQDYLENVVSNILDDAFNRGASHCFPVRITEKKLWLGPLIANNQKPCWQCLKTSLWKNRPVENYLSKCTGKTVLPKYLEPLMMMDFFVSPVILQLIKKLTDKKSGDNELIELDIWEMKIIRHTVRVRPQCVNCGDAGIYSKQVCSSIDLQNIERRFTSQGGYRAVSPEMTWDRYRHLVSPLTGIISHIDRYDKKNHSIRPVWKSTYFINPSTPTLREDEQFVKNSFGKGINQEQSRVSALCEAVERYAFIYTGDEPKTRSSYNQLNGTALDPETLQHFSKIQYADRDILNRRESPQKIPRPFDPDKEIDWTPVWNLTTQSVQYAPLQFCYSLTPTPEDENMCPFSSNGCAAGNYIEEAILQGFLELVERDAVAVWWYNRLTRPKVDLESFDDPYFIEIFIHYRTLGWNLWVLDVTNDLNIPAVVALAKNKKNGHFAIGLGCHLSMRLAVQRAITEMHQTFDPESRHDPVWKEDEIENPAFLFPDNNSATIAGTYPYPSKQTLKDDITDCITRSRKAGMEFVALNYTRPDIGLPTVKLIVPGLRHFWRQTGPGRLYTVPVKMGWLDKELTEDMMNPLELAL